MSTEKKVVGISLAQNEVVLVKFHFTNPRMIPEGIRAVDRKSERELMQKRQREQIGRGYEVLNNIQRVQVALLRTGLAANGFRLVDAHVYENRKPGKTTKHVVVLSFRRLAEGETAYELPSEAVEALRALATEAVWTAHVWQNLNGVVVADFVQRQPDTLPLHGIVTRNGLIVAEPTDRYFEEEEESRVRGHELLDRISA